MRPLAQNFFFYAAYLVTMMVMVGATFFIWNQEIFPMLKILVLLPLIYISVLLTLSLGDKLRSD